MEWHQYRLKLTPKSRGLHLITHEILAISSAIPQISIGFLHVFLKHTSASLTINENADPDVQVDMESSLNRIAPETASYIHTCEGPDDMPAHVKSSLFGCSLMVPISEGSLTLGTWQGIYLCEHRDRASARHLVITIQGLASSSQ